MAKKTAGRPPKFTSREEIEEKIDKYFEKCEGEVLHDEEGRPILNKFGNPVIIGKKPPTVTGLALALGFTSRQALLNYQAKKEFLDTITRAKSLVEQYTEERLFDRDGANGARFSLVNNFHGWTEKQPEPVDDEERKLRLEEQKLRIEEQKARIEVLKAKTEQGDGDTDSNDGFLEALNGTAAADWEGEAHEKTR